MTDDLVKRLKNIAVHSYLGRSVIEEAADRIEQLVATNEQLTAERDEAINQLDSAIHSQIVLKKRTAAVMEDRKFILEERDRTFALMLARVERAEAERDRLREAMEKLACKCSSNCDWEHEDVCPSWIARAALKGESHD